MDKVAHVLKILRECDEEYWTTDMVHDYDMDDWRRRIGEAFAPLSAHERLEAANSAEDRLWRYALHMMGSATEENEQVSEEEELREKASREEGAQNGELPEERSEGGALRAQAEAQEAQVPQGDPASEGTGEDLTAGTKSSRRRRGLRHSNPGQHHPKLPLQPLRKRRKLGSGDSRGSARGRAIAEAIDRDIAEVRGKTQEVAVLDDAWDKGKQD
jgi:hypothetical protein